MGERVVRRRLESPLVSVLDAGVASGLVVKDAENNIYTGFLQWKNVMDSSCQFESMNSNRAVNEDVVEARVSDNLRELAENQRFRDFGQINLLVLLNDPGHVFYVMDGQHRCKVMDRLHRKTGKDIKFQFRAKVVADEAEAHQELMHFQNCYVSDPRAFFSGKRSRATATAVLARLRGRFTAAELWVPIVTTRAGKRTGDPGRPRLNDFLVFWLLKDAGLAEKSEEEALQALLKMNRLLQGFDAGDRAKLGKGVTDNMIRSATRWGCFLGFFREDQLRWAELRELLDAPQGAAQGAEDARNAATCVVCMDAARKVLLRPCRHFCVCSTCAPGLEQCPVCNGPVESREDLYVQFLESRESMNEELVSIIDRIYQVPHEVMDNIKRKLRESFAPGTDKWNEQVAIIVESIAKIGDKAQDNRPDSQRVRKARAEQPADSSQVDLESRCKWYTGTLHLMARKMWDDRSDKDSKQDNMIQEITKLVNRSLEEFEEMEPELEHRLSGTSSLEAFIKKAVGKNAWLAPKVRELVEKKAQAPIETLSESYLSETEAWKDLHQELERLLEIKEEGPDASALVKPGERSLGRVSMDSMVRMHLTHTCPVCMPASGPLNLSGVPVNPDDVQALLVSSAMSDSEKENVARCLQHLETLLRNLDGDWCVRPFGSSANGFAIKDSDLDVTCFRPRAGQDSLAIYELKSKLMPLIERDDKFTLVEAIWSARVPILKMKFLDEGRTLEVDLSCQNQEALLNTELLKAYAKMHPLVRQIVVLVKQWTRALGLVGAKAGHLSSYSWTLMVIYFLQVHPETQLPCLPTLYFQQGATAAESQARWSCNLLPHQLLARFLSFYAFDFQWGAEVVSVRLGRRLGPEEAAFEFAQLPGLEVMRMQVEDPFLLGRNLNCVLGFVQEQQMQQELSQAAWVMHHGLLPQGFGGLIIKAAIDGGFKPPKPAQQHSDSEASTAVPPETRVSDSELEVDQERKVAQEILAPCPESMPLPNMVIFTL
ncbi:unnamed protein product [Effrenium voratum]|uniref:RING-type domain-containing protein n=1 Tax=Effrenium voratum TaxID=2562239 RepID=A0AA36HTE3_9DINO|nr:unnamed protein product [Effrenium voratum]